MTEIAPYGTWKSPITSSLVASGGVGLSQLWLDGDDLYWVESRSTEGGRCVLVRRTGAGEIADVTPAGFSVRTRVHEYGGRAFAVRDGVIWFSNDADGRLYRHEPGSEPRPITREPHKPRGLRYGDLRVTRDGAWVICVMETHEADATDDDTDADTDVHREPKNWLVVLAADVAPDSDASEPRALVTGRDFCAAPRLSPDGSRLAWLVWDHPRMPWDGTELFVAAFDPSAGLSDITRVAGGPDESIAEPTWSPRGTLHYVSDRTNWWNLYTADSERPVVAMDAEFTEPQWSLGVSHYGFVDDGRIVATYTRDGVEHLALITPGDGADAARVHEVDTPYSCLFGRGATLICAGADTVALIGASPSLAPEIALARVGAGASPSVSLEVVKRSSDLEVDPDYISVPRSIAFPTEGGKTAYALFYPPANRDVSGPDGERPPLIVKSHGGPTARAGSALAYSIQFWTSRGFAVVDVNYGGSTGYGREYRERLRDQWGVVDTQDCINAARYLAREGEVDGARLAIRGGSAGGYTTLCALTFHDVFAVGASYFGVADLETLARDTHKFESRYLDSLIGPYPETRDRYVARSPIHHIDQLSCPIIVLQGLEDKVVPPSQAESMIEAVERKGLPWAYIALAGEQHGFRKAENIQLALEAELYFYGRIFGFEPADELTPVDIKNLE